jgi:hypothetical protein
MFEVIFDRNGAKVYVKYLRVLSQKKSAKRGSMKSPSHSSTASGSATPSSKVKLKICQQYYDGQQFMVNVTRPCSVLSPLNI